MLTGIGLSVAGFVVGIIVKNSLPKLWRKFSIKFRADIKDRAAVWLTDPEVKAVVMEAVALAQKKLGKDANLEKLRAAGNFIKDRIPGPIDDAIVDALIELAVEELKQPIDLS